MLPIFVVFIYSLTDSSIISPMSIEMKEVRFYLINALEEMDLIE
jgi:hypothetical protein